MSKIRFAALVCSLAWPYLSIGPDPSAPVFAAVAQHGGIVLTTSPPDPQGHLSRGRSLILKKEFSEAITELNKSLELDPDNEQFYLNLVQAYVALKKIPEAEAILNKGLQRNRTSTTLYLAKGDLAVLQGKPSDAEAHYQRTLELNPDQDGLYAKLGQFYVATQQWEKAEHLYKKLADRKPQSDTPHLYLGEFYTFMGAGPQALAQFKHALTLNPASVAAQHSLINCYLINRQWKNTKALITSALQDNAHDVLAQVFQARLWLGQGKTDDAIARFQQILQDEPNQAMAHHYLGVAFSSKKDIPRAIEELETAATLAPQDRGIRKSLAWLRMGEGSFEKAVEEAQMALRLNPRDVQAVHLLGQAYLRQKDVTQAKKLYQAIVEQLPHDPVAHFQLGLIDQQDQNDQGAIDHFEKALRHNPNFTQTLVQIVRIRMSRSEATQARERVQQQIKAVPDNPSCITSWVAFGGKPISRTRPSRPLNSRYTSMISFSSPI
jgi:tetratricopeptide (TPR) repeat protein